MTADDDASDTLIIDAPFSGLQRAMYAAFGLVCILLPAWELRFALWPVGWWTVFFGVIVLGAWSVGFGFLAGAIAGDSARWVLGADGILKLTRHSLIRERRERIRGWDVIRTEIRTITWDSRADTYAVQLHLKWGETIETTDRGTRAAAEALEADIRRRMGIS